MKNVFNTGVSAELIARIGHLNASSRGLWGKMDAAQMLAHCNVTYELIYDNKHPAPKPLARFLLKLFVKKLVVGPQPYKRSAQTAPAFLIKTPRNFEEEKGRLVEYIKRTQQLGEAHFHNKVSHSFGPLSSEEWNMMFYKHLDHHLKQFGA